MATSKYDKKGYLTRASLIREIKDVVSKEHGLQAGDLLVNVVLPWTEVKYPTGLVAKCTCVTLRAPGFATRRFSVYQEAGRRWSMR